MAVAFGPCRWRRTPARDRCDLSETDDARRPTPMWLLQSAWTSRSRRRCYQGRRGPVRMRSTPVGSADPGPLRDRRRRRPPARTCHRPGSRDGSTCRYVPTWSGSQACSLGGKSGCLDVAWVVNGHPQRPLHDRPAVVVAGRVGDPVLDVAAPDIRRRGERPPRGDVRDKVRCSVRNRPRSRRSCCVAGPRGRPAGAAAAR